VPAPHRPVSAVVFDVGETLIDESRVWGRWADWMGTTRLGFFAALGATIAMGVPQRQAFEMIDADFRPWDEIQRRRAAGEPDFEPTLDDLYPDAVPALDALVRAGFRIGVAGNQFRASEDWLAQVRPAFDLIGSSETWGVSKPDPAFFARVAAELALPPSAIAYVGDRLDNDVKPARAAGMVPVHLRRGPWGYIQASLEPTWEWITVDSLTELPARLLAAG
jgi:HAD superfamily hydrolase (TIGR01549 family)